MTAVVISLEVQTALRDGDAVVALESSVITHGLPRPQNLEVARRMEAAVRASGAVPATVAVLDGWLSVGLTDAQLTCLANSEGVWKISRRDLPYVVCRKLTGGTTVAGTLIGAELAGIGVFATGGIGGVHRGEHMDVSADLAELSRTPVVVVCAGAKAVLDLPATLEWLETAGVPVIGYQTDEFPAFYSPRSGLRLEARADSAEEVAAIVRSKRDLGLTGGVVVCVPVPEHASMKPDVVNCAIEEALVAAERNGVCGKQVTPFLLARVSELTGGQSMRANLALLENNARVAAAVARHLCSA